MTQGKEITPFVAANCTDLFRHGNDLLRFECAWYWPLSEDRADTAVPRYIRPIASNSPARNIEQCGRCPHIHAIDLGQIVAPEAR